MTPRRIILALIVLTVVVLCLVAAVKLRATPKYDRIHAGMTRSDLNEVLAPAHWDGTVVDEPEWPDWEGWDYYEGLLMVRFQPDETGRAKVTVADKKLRKRGPLERLAWLAGWR